MPFGMGPAGWFFMPYIASWWGQTSPWAAQGYLYPQPWVGPGARQELDFLRGQEKALQAQLESLRARIEQLEKAEQQKT